MWSSCKKDILAGRYIDFYGLAELRCDASTEFDFDTVYTVQFLLNDLTANIYFLMSWPRFLEAGSLQ